MNKFQPIRKFSQYNFLIPKFLSVYLEYILFEMPRKFPNITTISKPNDGLKHT